VIPGVLDREVVRALARFTAAQDALDRVTASDSSEAHSIAEENVKAATQTLRWFGRLALVHEVERHRQARGVRAMSTELAASLKGHDNEDERAQAQGR